MSDEAGVPDDLRVGVMHHNLNLITRFHNHVHGFFNSNLEESQAADDVCISDKALLKREYETHFPNQLRKSVFLMMFGHLEEHLYLGWCDKGRLDDQKNNSDDGVKKFKRLYQSIGIDVKTDQDYQFIVDAYKVRNAIIHTAGRIDIGKSAKEIEIVISKHKGCYEVENKRINLTSQGISRFGKAVASFTERFTIAARSG